MRVLVVSKTLDVGGAERLIVDAANRRPRDVENAYLDGRGELASVLDAAIPLHDLPVSGRLRPRTLWRLWRLLRDGRFDVVHTHLPLAAVFVRLFAGRLPIVYTEHNVWSAYR